MTIGGIDLFIVVAYLVGIPIFGFYLKRYVKTEEDYFLAGRMLPWWVISMSITGTNIGAYDYMGPPAAPGEIPHASHLCGSLTQDASRLLTSTGALQRG